MRLVNSEKLVTDLDFETDVEPELPLLNEGDYELSYLQHLTTVMFSKKPTVIVDFRVVSIGRGHGCVISRYYNAERLIGRPGKGGRFKAKPKGDLYREFHAVVPGRHRADRLPMTKLREAVLVGEVVTVTHDREQRTIPRHCWYSRVKRLLRRA